MWDDGATWAGAREGTLLLKACGDCGDICHPPLPMCPKCQSTRMENRQASGEARLHSWLVSIRPEGEGEHAPLTIVAELAEGVRFVSNLVGADLSALREGMPICACFEEVDGKVLPLFRPAA